MLEQKQEEEEKKYSPDKIESVAFAEIAMGFKTKKLNNTTKDEIRNEQKIRKWNRERNEIAKWKIFLKDQTNVIWCIKFSNNKSKTLNIWQRKRRKRKEKKTNKTNQKI